MDRNNSQKMYECHYIQELVQFIGDKLMNLFIVGKYIYLFILWNLVSGYLYFVINLWHLPMIHVNVAA